MTNHLNELEELYQLSNRLKSITGRIDKENFIAQHKDNVNFQRYLSYVLDSLLIYGVQKKKLDKFIGKKLNTISFQNLFECFEYLKVNNTGRDDGVKLVASYIDSEPEKYHEWLIESITKSFKMGVTAKTVNKALGEDLIFNFDVMLAHPFEKYADKIKGEVMYVTEKLDGIRSLWLKENGKIVGFSRQGKRLENYGHIEEELLSLPIDNVVFDGELLVANADDYKDREVMQQTNSIASSKGDKSQLQLHLYDIIDLEGFKRGKSKFKYSERRETLNNLSILIEIDQLEHVRVLPLLYVGNDLQEVSSILSEVEKEGKEGLMINLDGYYTLTRSNQILKMKTFNTMDCLCTSVFEGEGRLKGKLGGIYVDYHGFQLGVGSGYSDKEREYYWNNQNEIVGKIVEVKYFRASENKDGGLSVSFPVYQYVRFDKDEPSYN